ncbi:ankyrin repeat and LEM domain-containing protein 2-like [Patiria miniata]|uniref:LEM domain-containing protein n=1 Tax=Patiria miniata TaxID=46514 RepID=A0A913ZVF3_PATMI|nr:ankyrin repeat and LEM domain-containing protein 2-like [Patiria miniata]XP_038055659.1 ankyrin repeat and LEM domain-containing protein 2-like [Patiria miniata]
MEAILQRLAKLTVDELRAELKSCGQKPMPITKTTRALAERRIAKYLWEQQGGGAREQVEGGATAKTEETTNGESNSEAVTSQQQSAKSQTDVNAVSSERNSPTSSAGGVAVVNYFAVCIPPKNETSLAGGDDVDLSQAAASSDEVLIFQDRKEVLVIAKKNKGARFKVFKTKEEAEKFAKTNQDLSTPKPTTEPTSSQPIAEKPVSSFRSVKPQDLVALRKTIEANEAAKFKELAWSNPRYLINAGDCPTVLQEGSRYNALHVVAKVNQPEICRQVLETIQDPAYILLMYPDDPEDTIISRIEYLTDLYLNSPDKGNAETPLHFACKFGHVEVVEILLNHPQCDKTLKNKYGQTASEIVCSWASLSDTAMKQLQKTITDLLHDHYYVPVYRAEDNCTQPVIGEPWSPDISDHQSSPLFHTRSAGAESPISTVLSLQAYAGPMSPAEADCFRRNLHTPPSTERKRVGRIKRADGEKGVERIGREIASKMQVSWAEYWNFMDVFADFSSAEGLQKLEDYLAERRTTINGDKADVRMPEPSVKQEQMQSVVSPGAVVKDLAGDFEKLTFDSSEDSRDGTDIAKETRISKDEQDQPDYTATDADRAHVDRTESRVVLESDEKMVDVSSEIRSPTADARDAAGHPGACTNGEGRPKMQTVEFEQGGQPAACDELDKIDSTSDRVKNIPISASNESKLKIKTIGTDRNLQDMATKSCQHVADDVDKPSTTDSDETDVDLSNAVCQSKISPQAPLCAKETTVKDKDPTFGDRTDGACPSCAVTEKSLTTGQNGGFQESQATLKHNAPETNFGERTSKEDAASMTTEILASGDQKKNEKTRAPPMAGNGDGNADIFRTPKMVSYRRVNNNVESRVQLKGGFILGAQPTKTDLHVWRALAEVEVPDNYPCIRRWKQLVNSVPCDARDRWPTPARCVPRLPLPRPSQTPSPRHLHYAGFPTFLGGSPLALRARHFSEPTHRSRETPGLRLRQAQLNGAESVGELKARLFQE